MEEAGGAVSTTSARPVSLSNPPMLGSVRLAVHYLLDILVRKELEYQRDVVRVYQQLREILKL
jgi:hypothetical protein